MNDILKDKTTVTVEEVAKILGISSRTAYEAIRKGDIPSTRIRGKYIISAHTVRKILKIEEAS